MDRNSENLWTRRSNNGKLSLSMSDREHGRGDSSFSSRNFSNSKRFGGDSSSHGGRGNPFNAISPLSTSGITSPNSTASSAFGLGSGAFASFGSATKTPKTPGTAFDFGKARESSTTPGERKEKKASEGEDKDKDRTVASAEQKAASEDAGAASSAPSTSSDAQWALKYTWVIWYRPPTSKNSDYERSIKPVCKMGTAQDFWRVYTHLKRPSSLPAVSDYHFFKENIRPVWEDEENKKGGKWIIRLKKGVSDRYWEDLLMAMVGDQFAEAGEEVCGMVLSVRSGEDVFSIWTKNDGGRNIKIRETIKRVLALPPDTSIIWKSHDDSIAQRSAIDQARQEKGGHHERRRVTLSSQDSPAQGDKSGAS